MNGNIFFESFLSGLDEKIISACYERHQNVYLIHVSRFKIRPNKHSSAMRRHDVEGNFARLFNDAGKFSMFNINLSYFPFRARLKFRWICKEFDLKSNMKGFFENFLALSVKKLKKVLMILPSISDRRRAFPAEYCHYMRCLAISNLYFPSFLVKKLKKVLMILLISQ